MTAHRGARRWVAATSRNRIAFMAAPPRRPPSQPQLKLPHEHDESAELSRVQHRVVRQAARDVASGQVDTDNYTRASAIAKKTPTKRRVPP